MMSCCGCASRVLKLQKEIRSWKTKLGDEKREKKMIMRWINTVFGYDVKVELEKETHVVRLQATENKEAMSKAIIKSVIGNEGDCGVMVMEVKLEDNEYFEPFEDPYEPPDFPILEINSMPTSTQQAPLVNTGIAPIAALGNLSQQNTQPLGIATPIMPMEIAATPIPLNLNSEQEVLYIAGSLEEGATLEGSNGQSYIIVRASENEDISVPVPMEYSTIVNETVISDNNVFYRPVVQSEQDNLNALNFITAAKPIPAPLPIPPAINPNTITVDSNPNPPPSFGIEVNNSASLLSKPSSKKKSSLSPSSKANMKASSKKKSISNINDGEMDIKIKSVSSKAISNSSISGQYEATKVHSKPKAEATLNDGTKQSTELESQVSKKEFVFGLTKREKAEMFVLQKAREAVEKLSNGNGFRCLVCQDSGYAFTNLDMAISHAKTHFESKPYKCDLCDELFAIQRELLTHRKTMHSKVKVVPAPSSISSRLSQSQSSVVQKSANSKTSLNTTTSGQFRLASSGATNSTSSTSSSSTKTIVVQAPFDKNFIRGPISVSNEVLAAILGAGVKVTLSPAE